MKKAVKILIIALCSLLALILLVLGGLNVLKFALYSDYYGIKDNVCKNPGLGDGFVCQGLCAYEDGGAYLVSGYMADGSPSRIYVTDTSGKTHFVTLVEGGEANTGHLGGIGWYGENIYLSDDDAIRIVPLKSVLEAQSGATVEITQSVPINNAASFLFVDDRYVYVGEFNDSNAYKTTHSYQTPEGLNHAIVSCYEHDDLTRPAKIYSIRDMVQGFCTTAQGEIVLSTSFGITSSVFYVYRESDAVDSGLTLDGAPVYYLTNCARSLKGPAMSEGLDYTDGKVITLFESASDKYIFGKFFFAYNIVSLDFSAE